MNSEPISRRDFTRTLLTGMGGALLAPSVLATAAASPGAPAERRQPNIVFILSDQHSYRYCGFMGHPVVRTPNLDRIATRGAVFRQTYCGSPLCAPSRAGMLSGCYPSDVNSFCNSTTWDGSLPAWPALLRDAGYQTFGCGKLDTDDRFDLGFLHTSGLGNAHATKPDITSFFRRPLCSRIEERGAIDGRPRAVPYQSDAHCTDATLDFIRQQGAQPWVTYTGFHLPHPPFVALEEHFQYYLNRVDLPNIRPGELDDLHFVYQQMRHFKNIATPLPEEGMRRARAAYYAMITELDGFIGRLWDTLEAEGQLENTIFIYTSDHGEALGDHGLWFKNNLFEGAARVPLVMAGPGIRAGQVIDTPVAHVDLIRTLLDWGGAKPHPKLRGHSLRPLLRGEPGDHPGWAYSESHSEGNLTGSFLVRKGDWKYLHFTWFDGLLFNLAEDPGELVNRIHDPAAAGVLKDLQAILASQVDPVEVTERGFRTQRKRMDRLAAASSEAQMVEQFRGRLGDGQALVLLGAYYGHPLAAPTTPSKMHVET
jgi:choline-sulfatase